MFLSRSPTPHWFVRIVVCLLGFAFTLGCPSRTVAQQTEGNHTTKAGRALLLAHYMPWFSAKPFSPFWGWHWTMGHFQPESFNANVNEADARRPIAAQYYPLIGPYDSSDPDVLDCQCLLMKLSGIDGVIIDWYGLDDHLDYAINQRNTLCLIAAIKKCGLKYAICYEDSTVPGLIAAGKLKTADAVEHGRSLLNWVGEHWFRDEAYVRLDGRPLFLVFGNGYYQGDQWEKMFAGLQVRPVLFTESNPRSGAAGGFDWPQPHDGAEGEARETLRFYSQARTWAQYIPAAYPRFHDIYEQAGVQKSYGELPDNAGKTYETSLSRALLSSANIVQIVTWNDWGEGTQIEPSREFGYRELETTQRLRGTGITGGHQAKAADLRLPVKLLKIKQRHDPADSAKLELAIAHLIAGHVAEARNILAKYPDAP